MGAIGLPMKEGVRQAILFCICDFCHMKTQHFSSLEDAQLEPSWKWIIVTYLYLYAP